MTRARVTKLDEFQFLTCLSHGLWGSKKARFKDWRIGDRLILIVGNSIAGLAEVSGRPFTSTEPVWDNDVFPHRLPIRFLHAASPENRVPLLGDVRGVLVSAFKADWGLGIVNQWLMDQGAADILISHVEASPNDLSSMLEQIESLLAAAKVKRQMKTKRPKRSPPSAPKRTVESPVSSPPPTQEPPVVEETDSIHLQAQALLVQLGRIVGCSIWVASNDRSRDVGGKALGLDCLSGLPNMGLSLEATKAIGLIDVIWLKKNAPVAAFEVEATTSVHSGLLRMSDLVELVPALRMDLYVVAPRERKAKVLRELARPTFRRIGLSDICRFVATDDLAALLRRLDGLKGFVHPDIIETIAIALPEQTESALA